MIRIFSEAFEFITEIDAVESVIWTSRWHKQGEFQIVVNQHMENVDELIEGRIVSNGSDKTGIIAHIEETTSESGKASDQLLVRGYDLKGILAKRFTIPPNGLAYDAQTANVETLMKRFVNNNAVTTSLERIIENLTIAPDLSRGSSFFYQTRFKNLADELEKLSVASGIGWDVLFNGTSYVFDVIEGRDLRSIQTVNPPVIFSAEFDNVKSQTVVESALDYKNVAIVAGQGEGASREVVFIGSASGLARNEIYIDARDIEEGGNLLDRGQQKLAEYARIESFETSILTYGPFEYGTDWRLGDVVTVQNAKKTRTAHLRVTEVVEVTERDGYRLDATFGQPMPTIIEMIKRELDEPVAEGGSSGGEPGADGVDGYGLNYVWQGTSLGVKRDDETTFVYTNLVGPQGVQGNTGATGAQGIQGVKGDKGDTGSTGPQGVQGLKGDKGDTGSQGIQGPIGLTGPQGPKGDTGATGPAGSTTLPAGTGLTFETQGLAKGRLHTLTGVPNWVGWTLNASFSAQGWNLDDTTLPGWFMKLDVRAGLQEYAIYKIPAGANPHTNEYPVFRVSGADDEAYIKTNKVIHTGNISQYATGGTHVGTSPPSSNSSMWIDTN